MTITASLSPDWIDAGDEAILESGQYRVVVDLDRWPEEPEHDYGCPVIQLEVGYGGRITARFTGYGIESWRTDGINGSAEDVLNHFAANIESIGSPSDLCDVFSRFLRIYHGGSAKLLSIYAQRSDYDYLVYDTRAMRAEWGQDGEMLETSAPEGEEWEAYVNGEVYTVTVQERKREWRQASNAEISTYAAGNADPAALYVESEHGLLVSSSEEWEDVDYCGGFYGRRYAQESAEEQIVDRV